MSLIRRIDNFGDWSFGRGKTDYLTENNCVGLDIITKIKEWKYDCFYAFNNGIDWRTRLGDKSQKTALDDDVVGIISQNNKVRAITSFESSLDTTTRTYTASISIITIYGDTELNFNIGGSNA